MTDAAPRRAGLRGRRTARHVPELRLRKFAPPSSPPPPKGDVTGNIPADGWQMLGNDQYGDCGPAATEHYRDAKANQVIPSITTDATVKLYFGYGIAQGEPGPQPDKGVDNATWLHYLFTHDANDNVVPAGQGLVEAFAELDLDADVVHQAMNNFNGVLIGCVLTDDAEKEFEERKPWRVSAKEPIDANDGHDVLLVKYDTTSRTANETVVTWGQLQEVTVGWERHEQSSNDLEAWVIITAEDAARNGVDLAALQAAITAWGGTVAAHPAS